MYQEVITSLKQLKVITSLKQLKEYLNTEALEKPVESVDIDFFSERDKKKIKKYLLQLDIARNCFGMAEVSDSLTGSPFFFALITEEFEAAEKILKKIERVSLTSLGYIEETEYNPESSFGNYIVKKADSSSTLETLLYLEEFKIPEQLRTEILRRLDKEADDLFRFSLKRIKNLDNIKVQKKLAEDVSSFPNLFRRKEAMYASNMKTLLFLMKLFQDDNDLLCSLLKNNGVSDRYILGNFSIQDNSLEKDAQMFEKLVQFIIKNPKVYLDFWIFSTRLITKFRVLRTALIMDADMHKKFVSAEQQIWNSFAQVPFSENDFHELKVSIFQGEKIDIEILYELAWRKLGKKQPLQLQLDECCNMSNMFGIFNNSGRENYFFGQYESENFVPRLADLLEYVQNVEYVTPEDEERKDMRKEFAGFLIENAETLKDSFGILIRKGFIPDEYMDYVMKRVSNNQKCEYMRPLLIMHKYKEVSYDKK